MKHLCLVIVFIFTCAILCGCGKRVEGTQLEKQAFDGTLTPAPAVEDQQPEQEQITTPELSAATPTLSDDGAYYIELDGVKVLIVNKEYHLTEDFGGENQEALDALNEMFGGAWQDGYSLWVASGYRSYSYQSELYNGYIEKYGQEYTDTISAKPGCSEHQTGLAFDLNSLSDSFAETKEYEWLKNNCAKYGFILRFLPEKQWATGYMFEPWHYRYIGDADLAQKIMDSGLSLEEYAGLV